MKKSILKTSLSFSILALILCFSCGEKEDPDLPLEDDPNNAVLKMNVNDVPWAAQWAYTITSPSDDEDDDEDYFVVLITGTNGDYEADEEDMQGDVLTFYIAIPKSKFNTPIGTYPLSGSDELDDDYSAAAIFNKVNGDRTTMYVSSDRAGEGKPVGTISIESFKIGQQKIMGQDLGQGYVALSGSFTVNEMTGYENSSEGPIEGSLKLTQGKFDVKNGWNFGLVGMDMAFEQASF